MTSRVPPDLTSTGSAHTSITPTAKQIIQGYNEFEIDIGEVIRRELPPRFQETNAAQLTGENIRRVPERAKGAYILHVDRIPVYAGKTDTRHGFRDRLRRHHFTLQHRTGIDLSHVTFKAVRVMVFSNFDVEAILINEMRRVDQRALSWNDTGFGSNDPGHNREREEPGEFDRMHPINIDMPLDDAPLQLGPTPVFSAFMAIKEWLPYTFRWQTDLLPDGKSARWNAGHADFRAETAKITILKRPFTARDILRLALDVLPAGWRVTVFPGRVIIYRESITYRFALEYFEKSDT